MSNPMIHPRFQHPVHLKPSKKLKSQPRKLVTGISLLESLAWAAKNRLKKARYLLLLQQVRRLPLHQARTSNRLSRLQRWRLLSLSPSLKQKSPASLSLFSRRPDRVKSQSLNLQRRLLKPMMSQRLPSQRQLTRSTI